jgi:esterase/lipase superfamily enzyme/nucleoid DNA-binding protein
MPGSFTILDATSVYDLACSIKENKKMSKMELAKVLAIEANVSIKTACRFIESFIEVVGDELVKNGIVTLRGFGRFKVSKKKARVGRNPATGQAITIPHSRRPKFVPDKRFREKFLFLKKSIAINKIEKKEIKRVKVQIQCMAEKVEDDSGKLAIVRIFFGTDRRLDEGAAVEDLFGSLRGDGTTYGVCDVNIPPEHRLGRMERPHWWKFEFSENVARHIVLLEVSPLDPVDFASSLKKRVDDSAERDVLVFVHGYNVTFGEAARRTAQLAYDLPFSGAPVLFSWPSDGKVERYLGDCDDAAWSVPHLEEFLNNVIAWSGATKINLIAHSMGGLALVNALVAMAGRQKGRTLFNNIILAAPDIDRDIFVSQILPQMTGSRLSMRTTLYASSHDRALQVSRKIRGPIPRAGEGGEDIVVAEGLDSIDASRVPTDLLGHGYFASTKDLLIDIYHLLANNLPPSNRGLRPRMKQELKYWILP